VFDTERGENAALNAELRAARAELDKTEKDKRTAVNPYRTSYYMPAQQPAASNQPYYRGYHQYAYPQGYTSTGTAAPAPSTSVSTSSTSASASASNYVPQTTGTEIPVQLPVSSLPALHALGIHPVASSSLAEGTSHPAVLRGSSADGTMLSLEINVSLLQTAQMNGLALFLNSLITRNAAVPPTPVANDAAGG